MYRLPSSQRIDAKAYLSIMWPLLQTQTPPEPPPAIRVRQGATVPVPTVPLQVAPEGVTQTSHHH